MKRNNKSDTTKKQPERIDLNYLAEQIRLQSELELEAAKALLRASEAQLQASLNLSRLIDLYEAEVERQLMKTASGIAPELIRIGKNPARSN
jgi:uncharacterized membrane-anchored protein